MSESNDLQARLLSIGRRIGEREAAHSQGLVQARERAGRLYTQVAAGLEHFRKAVREAGAEHLVDVELGPPRLDEKHVRAIEFELARGRTRALVVVKSRGDITLVGPFQTGKAEGPCKRFAPEAESDIQAALGDFLEEFLEAAATP